MNTEKRIFSGVFVGFIGFALGFIQSILLVPILLSFWGTETYGIWLVLNAGYIILQTLDSGQQAYIGNELNIKFFSDKEDLRVVLASSLRMAFLIGIFQLLIIVILIITNTTHLFLGLDAIVVTKEYLTICLLLLIIAWTSSGTYRSILSKLMIPYGYYSKIVWWSIYNKIGTFIVLVLIAFNNGSILDATIGISLFTIVFNFLLLLRIKTLIPDVYPWWHLGSWKIGWVNLRKSSLISFSDILQQLSNNGLILLITNLFGAIIVPIFTTIRTLTNSAVSITNIIIQPLQPEIVRFHVQKDFKKIMSTFNINWLISGFLINIGILIVIPFITEIYHFWTRGKLEFNLPLFLLLAIDVSLFNFGSVLVYYLHSINRITQQFRITILKLILIISISILFSKFLGLISVGIGIAVAELIAYIILPYWFIKREFNLHGLNFASLSIFLNILPIFTLSFISFLIILFPTYILYFSLSGILILSSIYFISWKNIPIELKRKIISLLEVKNILRKV